jgi:oligoribonuclease NrnB/cAMP/cGMP phosphodiesterase (DHH superfamily)
MIVIYHANCADGFTAAWAARHTYGDAARYVPANYGEAPPDVSGYDVVIVDFSYPRETLLAMSAQARSILVLDHHKTAAADLAGLPFATFDMARSGAGLAWDILRGSVRPWLVDYVEDRDLWRFALPQSKEINAWISTVPRGDFARWDALDMEGPDQAAIKGAAVLACVEGYVRDMSAQARNVEFAGHTVPIVNAPFPMISELVGHLAETAPFAIGWSMRRDGQFSYSLRSRGADGVDVSEIAKRYGGGGHRNAAGFTSRALLGAPCAE